MPLGEARAYAVFSITVSEGAPWKSAPARSRYTIYEVLTDDKGLRPLFSDVDVQAYVKNVERAASDLGSRKGREIALDNKLSKIFPKDS